MRSHRKHSPAERIFVRQSPIVDYNNGHQMLTNFGKKEGEVLPIDAEKAILGRAVIIAINGQTFEGGRNVVILGEVWRTQAFDWFYKPNNALAIPQRIKKGGLVVTSSSLRNHNPSGLDELIFSINGSPLYDFDPGENEDHFKFEKVGELGLKIINTGEKELIILQGVKIEIPEIEIEKPKAIAIKEAARKIAKAAKDRLPKKEDFEYWKTRMRNAIIELLWSS